MRCTAVFHCQVWNSFFFFFFFLFFFSFREAELQFWSFETNFAFSICTFVIFFFFIGEHSIFLLLSSQGWCMWWNQRFLLLHVVGICIILK